MSCLLAALLLSLLVFPCRAETIEEQFFRMDRNKDGFLSKEEFIKGMEQGPAELSYSAAAPLTGQISAAKKQKIIDESVAEAKKILPFKVDQATTWTDVYGSSDEIHYVYQIEMDIGSVPAEQTAMLKPLLEEQICTKVKPAMCGIANDLLLKNGISLKTHYNDKSGRLIAECRFIQTDCE
ncbi:MAG: hypothetical protein IJ752_01220 [Alphaproteobacteria bacterium]|nr:hypothetical protein [Alphaproteobacteria bacterium]